MMRNFPAALLTGFATVASLAYAVPAPEFEVAAVKLSVGGSLASRSLREEPGRFSAHSVSLRWLIAHAYSLESYQLSGGSPWMTTEFYDVEAKAATPAAKEDLRQMLQALLAERFHLQIHKETKEMPVYVLAPAKDGPKFQESRQEELDKPFMGEPGKLRFRDVPSLAGFMSGFVDRPVLDRTGLTGRYDIALKMPRPETAAPAIGGPADVAAAMEEFGANLLALVDDQLGLKAKAVKAPVEIFVVDGAGRVR